jgi:hypothetical protein
MNIGLAIMVIAVIYFLIVSPGVRKAAAFIFVGIFVGLAVLTAWSIYHSEETGRQEQQQWEEAQRFAATAIKPSDLALEDVAFVKPSYCLGMESSSICISDWTLKGVVTNNSNYALAWMTFEIEAVDCPVQRTVAATNVPRRNCRTVGQVQREAPASVPPGQTREFSSYAIKFEGIPPTDQQFQRTFSWTLIKASLGFRPQ